MAEGEGDFRLAGAYVEIGTRDHTQTDVEEIKARIQAEDPAEIRTKAEKPSAESLAAGREEIEKQPAAKIPAKVDKSKVDSSAKDAGDSGGHLMAAGLSAALLAGGPLVGAAMTGVGVVGLTALAATLHSGDPQIKTAWSQLSRTAVDGARQASAVMVAPIADSMGQITGLLRREQPEFAALFRGAAQDVPIVTSGIDQLATNALPGLDDALNRSVPIAQGVSKVFGDIGTAAGSVGHAVASNSQAIGSSVGALGDTTKIAGNAIGDLISGASHLAVTALPGLNGVLGLTEEGVHGVTNAVSAFGVPLGTVTGSIVAGVLAQQTLGKGLDSLGGKLDSAGQKLTTSDSEFRLYGASVSTAGNVLQALGGAVPFVAAGVSALSSVVQEVGGNFNEFDSAVAQGGAAFDQALSKTQAFGQGTMTVGGELMSFWDSITGQGVPSLANLYGKLDDVGKAQFQLDVANQRYGQGTQSSILGTLALGDAYQSTGDNAKATTTYQTAYNTAVAEFGVGSMIAKAAAGDLANITLNQAVNAAQARDAMNGADGKATQLATDMGILASNTDSAANKATALHNAMDLLTNENLSLASAQQTANQDLINLQQLLTNNTAGLRGHAAALIEDSGLINSSTAAGQALNGQLLNMATGYSSLVTATYNHAIALGQTDVQATAAATAAAQGYVDRQQEVLTKLGLTPAQVQQVIHAYGMVPGDVHTQFSNNAGAAIGEINGVRNAINSLPNYKSIGINIDLSGPGAAVNGIAGLLGVGRAQGGIDLPARGFAEGGIATATPLSTLTPIAQVVPPNTLRVVGDNPTRPESFIPWNGSVRSRAIWEQTGTANGWLDTNTGGGTVVHNTNHNETYNVSTQDPTLAAQVVIAEQQWQRMIRSR